MSVWNRRKSVAAAAIVAVASIPSIAVVVSSGGEEPTKVPASAARYPGADAEESWTPNVVSESEMAVVGQDGWVFYGDAFNKNYSQATGARRYSAAEIAGFAASLGGMRDYLASHGVPLVFTISPAKWEIYGDKIGRPSSAVSPLDQLISTHPELDIVDTRQALIDARDEADTYSKLNGHWTSYGGYVAWQALQDQVAAEVPEIAAPVPTISGVEDGELGNEFADFAGISGDNPATVPVFSPELPEVEVIEADGTTGVMPAGQSTDMLEMPRVTVNAQAPSDSTVLVLCDSTCTALSPTLQASYARLVQVRHSVDAPEHMPNLTSLLAEYEPDAVVFVMTERYLDLGLPVLPR